MHTSPIADAPRDPLLTAEAYLIDVDGTLLDSNYLHVVAWQRALRETRMSAPAATIHRAIGLDAQKLLDRIVPSASDEQREQALTRHGEHYAALSVELQLLPGARALLRTLRERNVRVVLATSAPQQEVDRQLAVLDADDLIDAITTGEDVETAKPDPEVFHEAMRRAGTSAEKCVAIGDSRWDVIAAARAGVRAVGVETGGTDRPVLLEAGAVAVHPCAQQIADLLRRDT